MNIDEALEAIQNGHPEVRTQEDLASLIGISGALISTYKNGQSRPNITNACKIWGKFGIQVEPFTEKSLEYEWQTYHNRGNK